MGHPVIADRPRFDIGEIVSRHINALDERHVLTTRQRRVLLAICRCRTGALGGHVYECDCGYTLPVYNSCLDRHCPKCQGFAQEAWIAARAERLLPVKHFHVVFTLPEQLRSLAAFKPRHIYNALFSAASATLQQLARSKYGVRLGITMILHTWARNMQRHPHLHAIVTAGGLALDGSSWKSSSPKYLLSVKAMGKLLRGKMLRALSNMKAEGKFEGFDDFHDPGAFGKLMARLARQDWVVYAKRPFPKADHVLSYLGRYTHRVAISNSRLLSVTDESVTFSTKHGKTATLHPVEFVRRFAQHILPRGFHKIRHYGLYSGAACRPDGKRNVALALLGPQSTTHEPTEQQSQPAAGDDSGVRLCPNCGAEMRCRLLPRPRAPPCRLAS